MLIMDVLGRHVSHFLRLRSRLIGVSGTTEETSIVKISSEVNITGRSDTVMAKYTAYNVE
jgi:rRNA processing protein Krr1/Pno1